MIKAVIIQSNSAEVLSVDDSGISFPNFEVLGRAFSIRDGIRMIETYQPNLVLLDLEMPEGSGWKVFEATQDFHYEKIVISDRALSSIRVARFNVTGHLQKPLQPRTLREKIEGFLFSKGELAIQVMYERLFLKQKALEMIAAPTEKGLTWLATDEIDHLQSNGSGTVVKLSNGRRIHCTISLDRLANRLALGPFFRVNPQFIIRLHPGLKLKCQGDVYFLSTGEGSDIQVPYQRIKRLKNKLSER